MDNQGSVQGTFEVPAGFSDEVLWHGGTSDHCVARLGDLHAYCERLGEGCWCAAVYLNRGPAGKEELFHSIAEGVLIARRDTARRLCEWAMRAERSRQSPPAVGR